MYLLYDIFIVLSILIILLSVLGFLFPSHVYAQGAVIINEVSVHPGTGNKEWVELYVADGTDLMTYWIDDDTDYVNDSGGSTKKRLENLSAGSDDHYVVAEMSSSLFNNTGDSIVLFDNSGNIVDSFSYAEDPGNDISLGRYPDISGSIQILEHQTKGSLNSAPKPSPTATPEPTSKPTKAPTPTKVPTIAKSNTPTKLPNLQSTQVPSGVVKNVSLLNNKNASNGAYPTAILGESTISATQKPTQKPKKVMVQSANTNHWPAIMVMVGGSLMIACGILLFLKRMRN